LKPVKLIVEIGASWSSRMPHGSGVGLDLDAVGE
jgi:hypothetical protein